MASMDFQSGSGVWFYVQRPCCLGYKWWGSSHFKGPYTVNSLSIKKWSAYLSSFSKAFPLAASKIISRATQMLHKASFEYSAELRAASITFTLVNLTGVVRLIAVFLPSCRGLEQTILWACDPVDCRMFGRLLSQCTTAYMKCRWSPKPVFWGLPQAHT